MLNKTLRLYVEVIDKRHIKKEIPELKFVIDQLFFLEDELDKSIDSFCNTVARLKEIYHDQKIEFFVRLDFQDTKALLQKDLDLIKRRELEDMEMAKISESASISPKFKLL